MKIKIYVEDGAKLPTIPTYTTAKSAGADLYLNNVKYESDNEINTGVSIKPGETKLLGTGIHIEIPDGYFGAIYARSGLATKENLAPANCVGVIDSDYTGEIMVAMRNHGNCTRHIKYGDRIAQLVIQPYSKADFIPVESEFDLSETERGSGGFGSTGKNEILHYTDTDNVSNDDNGQNNFICSIKRLIVKFKVNRKFGVVKCLRNRRRKSK